MTREELQNVVKNDAVRSRLLRELFKLRSGIQKITVTEDGRQRRLKAVRLSTHRIANRKRELASN